MPPSAPVTTTVLPPVAAAPDAMREIAEEKEHTEGRPTNNWNAIAIDDLLACSILPQILRPVRAAHRTQDSACLVGLLVLLSTV